MKKKRKKKKVKESGEWEDKTDDLDFIRQTLYHKKKPKNESPERRENIYTLIQKGENEYKKKQKGKSRSKSKVDKSGSVIIKKKSLLNKSTAGSVIKSKKKSKSTKKSKKRRKTKTSDQTKKEESRLYTESGREIVKRNGRYDEEPETSGMEDEGFTSGAMRKRFMDSGKDSEDDLENEYITFTSKLSKRKSKGIKNRRSGMGKKSVNKKDIRKSRKMREEESMESVKKQEVKKRKSEKPKKKKKRNKTPKEKLLEEEHPRKLTLKTKKKAKALKKAKKEALADSDIGSEADIDEFEDSNFLKGKSLWGEELNSRVKSKSEVKLYRKKKKNKGKSVKKEKGRGRKSSIDKILNYDTLPLKDDTLDKFAKLQKRSAVKKRKTRNNSLLSLRSAYSNQDKK